MRARLLCAAALAASLTFAALALADADVQRGAKALRAAYQATEGDEGGFAGTLVEQCRAEGESMVRCVIVNAEGASDLDTYDAGESRTPVDFGVATFDAQGQITTSREPFREVPVELDADISVRERLRRTRSGRILVRVSPAVPATVTVAGRFGKREIARPRRRERTVSVAGGTATEVAVKLTRAQRNRIRRALRRTGEIRAVISVRVVGDVGPADATQLRVADVHVVR